MKLCRLSPVLNTIISNRSDVCSRKLCACRSSLEFCISFVPTIPGSGLYCLPLLFPAQYSAHVCEVHTKVIGDRTLSVSVLLNGLGYLPIPLAFVSEYTLSEYFVKLRTVGKPLALGYRRNIPVSFKMIAQTGDKIVFTENRLALNFIPDCLFTDPTFDKLAVFFLCFGSCSAELAEHPVYSKTRLELFLTRCCPIAGPFPIVKSFDRSCADGIQHHITAYFKEMAVFLNKNGLIPALEEMSGFLVAFVPRLSKNAV